MNADEIEHAIESLEYLIGGDCCDNQMDFVEEIELALAALREQAERKKGCRYCNTTQNRYLTDDIYMATTNSYGDKRRVLTSNNGMRYKTLGFCPSCGKRLEVEP